MNKRSAMLMAAGLVLTMIVAGIAITAGLTGPSASAATPRAAHHHAPKPIVKTIHKTETVHKKAPQSPATTTYSGGSQQFQQAPQVQQVVYASPSASGFYADDSGHDDVSSYTGGGGDD